MLNGLMDPRRVWPFEDLKRIVHGDQSTDLTLFIGRITSLGDIALITLLQVRVCEFLKGLKQNLFPLLELR
jgi:hypothetical protein